ncbi:MAG: putative membrane protein YedE/YeeE [Myxococcota bacterium]|jgi:uncharacterized membrane protein YedE/YeeE
MFTEFTPLSALAGGALIGLAASVMLLSTGRIAGISGIYKGILRPVQGDLLWRIAFMAGLVAAGGVLMFVAPSAIENTQTRSIGVTAIAGLVVGVGVTMGNGCTSGHGVCGLSRFSRRSLVATLTFLATGMATATAIQVFFGGSL